MKLLKKDIVDFLNTTTNKEKFTTSCYSHFLNKTKKRKQKSIRISKYLNKNINEFEKYLNNEIKQEIKKLKKFIDEYEK